MVSRYRDTGFGGRAGHNSTKTRIAQGGSFRQALE
jgi:hypothetical protein